MITCTLNNLDPGDTLKLRKYLTQPEMALLLRVIDSHVQASQAKALGEVLEGDVHPLKFDAGNGDLFEAQRWHHAATILRQLSEQTEPFKTATLS